MFENLIDDSWMIWPLAQLYVRALFLTSIRNGQSLSVAVVKIVKSRCLLSISTPTELYMNLLQSMLSDMIHIRIVNIIL